MVALTIRRALVRLNGPGDFKYIRTFLRTSARWGQDKTSSPILLPTALTANYASRNLFTVAYRRYAIGRYSKCHKVISNGLGPFGCEGQIVFTGTTFVTVAFHFYSSRRILLQPFSITLENIASGRCEV